MIVALPGLFSYLFLGMIGSTIISLFDIELSSVIGRG